MSKTRILIVEDEGIVATELASKLEQLGHEIVGTTAHGEEAVSLASRLRPELVLMDIWLKGPMDGIEAAEAIRGEHDVPVVYLTAHSDPTTLARAKITDPFGYILKPFEERELATQIELALHKHRADREVRQQREWLRVTLASIADAVIATDPQGRITFINAVAESLTGWNSEQGVGRPLHSVFRVINEETGQPLEDPVVRVLREGRAVALANHAALVTKDGRTVLIEDSAAPILDAAGKVVGVVLVFHDVTEKRRMEEARRSSEQRLAGIVGSAMDAIISVDADGRIVLFNAAAEKMFCCPIAQAVGQPLERFIPERFRETHVGNVQAFGADGTTSRAMGKFGSLTALRANGEEFPMEASISQVEVGGQKVFTVIVRDITERKRAEAALVESEAKFRQLANSIPQLAWIARADGWIFWYNDRWYEYTGMTPEEMQGWGWQGVHDPEELPKVLERWKASIATGQPFDMEFPLRGADSHFRWFLTRVMPLRDSQGQIALWFGTNTDITQQREVAEHLQRAKEAAEAASEAKTQFLMNMSHELRTPMNSVMGMMELVLAEKDLSLMAKDCLQTAKDSADGLLELINQILDFSRIEKGALQLDSRPFAFRALLDKTLKPLAIRAAQKKLELTCTVEADVPDALLGDALALRQVLTNLVGNAIKFTHKGDVVVRVKLSEKSSTDVLLEFAVSDTGIGISPDDQDRIFAPFAQVDASLSRQYGGTGLGLAISNKLVMLGGGKMWVESNIGSGSIFHFTVRFGFQRRTGEESDAAKVALTRLHHVPVLVADDNAASRRSMEQMLAAWAMRPEFVADVQSAVTRLHQAIAIGQPYPIVIANAVMPGIDGFTLAEWINNNQSLAGSIILMISTLDRQEMAERCRQVKAIYVEKPASQAGLLAALTRAVAGKTMADSEPTQPEIGEFSRMATKPLRILVAEDNPPNQKFIVLALQGRGHHVMEASTGQEALDLLRQHDFDAVLMDLQMPVMDGLEATAAIRKLEAPSKAKVPINSSTGTASRVIEDCTGSSLDERPVKGVASSSVLPTDVKELQEEVRRLRLERISKEQELMELRSKSPR